MLAEFGTSLWANEVRPKLAKEIAEILSESTDDARAAFLERSLEAIDEYKNLILPSLKAGLGRDARMERLAEAGRRYAQAVAAIDEDDRSLLLMRQRQALGSQCVPDFAETVRSGEWAGMTARAAQRLRRHRSEGGPSSMAAPLIETVATIYGNCTGQRPVAARMGRFARALAALFVAADMEVPGEKAIRTALTAEPTQKSLVPK